MELPLTHLTHMDIQTGYNKGLLNETYTATEFWGSGVTSRDTRGTSNAKTMALLCPLDILGGLPLPSQRCLSVLYPFKCWTSSKGAAHTIFKVFGMTQSGFEPPTTQMQSGRSTHYMTESDIDHRDLLGCFVWKLFYAWKVTELTDLQWNQFVVISYTARGCLVASIFGSTAVPLMQCLLPVSWYSSCQLLKDDRLSQPTWCYFIGSQWLENKTLSS